MRTFIKRTCAIIAVALTLLGAATLSTAPALAASDEGCPNEAVRRQSNTNPVTGQPYSVGLPECRAYEMVSPLEKQAHNVIPQNRQGIAVAPGGETVGFMAEAAFSNPGTFPATIGGRGAYIAERDATGWKTSSSYAPASIIEAPSLNGGIGGDFSMDLRAAHVECGEPMTNNNYLGPGIRCALREPNGSWTASPIYTSLNGTTNISEAESYLGASATLSTVVLQPNRPLLPADVQNGGGSAGLYELSGLGTPSPDLRLVNVDNDGNELLGRNGAQLAGPLLGDARHAPAVSGTAFQAISESGQTVFFTATPTATQQPAGEQQTVYARLHHSETISVSNPVPAECTTCNPASGSATYQGASANGEKVFFTTTQQLANTDTDSTNDLYEYDFANSATHHLMQLSGGGLGDLSPGSGANVQSVLRISADGSHVYFLATGVLTTVPNGLGQVAQEGQENLYGYDTVSGETRFVATGGIGGSGGEDEQRLAQTTPDGEFLVFSTSAKLVTEDTNSGEAVYRYDFRTGGLAWISHGAPGFAPHEEGDSALVAPLPGTANGAEAAINDFNRTISDGGNYVLFTTAEKLQANDVDNASDVYLWHEGTVSMISSGQDAAPTGDPAVSAGMSSSGEDIFFMTHTPLVGQDTDELQDLYDARIGGGFPAPAPGQSCSGEQCQGAPSAAPTFSTPGTASFTGGANDIAPPFKPIKEVRVKKKAQTKSELLKRALAKCENLRRAKRKPCDKAAKVKYGSKSKAAMQTARSKEA
jgi:hypothetical protein